MFYDIIQNSFIYYLIFNLTYYTTGGILLLIDYFKKFVAYKCQQDKSNLIIPTYKKIIPTVLYNTLLSTIPTIIIIGYYDTNYINKFNLNEIFFHLPLGFILSDVFFWIFHRTLHIPFLYKKFHKKHHEIISPIGLSAVYTTTFDFYFGNIAPVYLPMFLLKVNPFTMKLWMIITTFNTVFFAHSGFNISNFHDNHHLLFNKNYGANLIMDRLMNTYHSDYSDSIN